MTLQRNFRTLLLALSFVLISNAPLYCQAFAEETNTYREKYKSDFLSDERSPLGKEDIQYLSFFSPDESYKVRSSFSKTENAIPFDMPTMNGITKKYIEYGTLSFSLHNKPFTLKIYQSLKLAESEEYKDYLFLPFTDSTNGNETYGGGRYLDFRTGDIINNELIIDFNKCYNPYCAYKSGYSCPKPPEENNLHVSILAGEKKISRE